MSKRAVFTNVTALPAGISRETVMNTFYSHVEIIDLQPMVQSRVPCRAPPKASPEESTAAWYELVDKVHYLPGGLYSGKVKYYVCFHDLTDGVQTHVYAPAGLDIKAKWTLGGSLPGELRGPTELGLGLPKEGLYLREDVDMKCNFMLIGFVKKNMQKAHKTLVERLIEKSHLKERDQHNQRLTMGANTTQTMQHSLSMSSRPASFGGQNAGGHHSPSTSFGNSSTTNTNNYQNSFNVAEIDSRTVEITPAAGAASSSSSSNYNRDSKHSYEPPDDDLHPAMRHQSAEPPPLYAPPAAHSPYQSGFQLPPHTYGQQQQQQHQQQQEQQQQGYGQYHSSQMQYPPQQYPPQLQHQYSVPNASSYGQAPPQPQYAYQWAGMHISPDQMQKQQVQYAQMQHEHEQQQQQQGNSYQQPQQSSSQPSRQQSPQQRYESAWYNQAGVKAGSSTTDPPPPPAAKGDGFELQG